MIMGILKIYATKSKPANKKPGWKKTEAEYKAWLHKMNTSTLFATKLKPLKAAKKVPAVPQVISSDLCKPTSLNSFGGSGTKPVARPDILYKHEPELLQRELKARERKFTSAPVYNKGGAMFITDEMMLDITAGTTRRR